MSMSWNTKKDWGTEEIGQQNATHDSGFSFVIKVIIETINKIWIKVCVFIIVIYQCQFPNFATCMVVI